MPDAAQVDDAAETAADARMAVHRTEMIVSLLDMATANATESDLTLQSRRIQEGNILDGVPLTPQETLQHEKE
jgi:hypothetical protein